MPNFENPAAAADDVQTALRGLAHATRRVEDPRQIYSVLGSLTSAVASLSQSLHQLGTFHDHATTTGVWVAGDSHAGRARTYQVSWELHRAAEILHQVAESIGHAHEAEAQISYTRPAPTPVGVEAPRRAIDGGLSL